MQKPFVFIVPAVSRAEALQKAQGRLDQLCESDNPYDWGMLLADKDARFRGEYPAVCEMGTPAAAQVLRELIQDQQLERSHCFAKAMEIYRIKNSSFARASSSKYDIFNYYLRESASYSNFASLDGEDGIEVQWLSIYLKPKELRQGEVVYLVLADMHY
jgi:hypothetical protein